MIDHLSELKRHGFALIGRELMRPRIEQLRAALDRAIEETPPTDIRIGTLSTRVSGLMRCSVFESLYMCSHLVEACRLMIGDSFRLSSLHARTVHAGAGPQELHVDFRPGERPFPLVGFVYMIDDFDLRNGATRFVPGSHMWPYIPENASSELLAEAEAKATSATGPAGSLIIFSGTTWHGHGPNLTAAGRRSVQGAFVPQNVGTMDSSSIVSKRI